MNNTECISYAFREDPATIITLEDGGVHFKNVYQITAFRRKLIRPELIDAPLFFCDNNAKYYGQSTDIMNQIFDDNMSIKYDYAVVVDSQVEFEVDYSILNKLSKEYMPSRDAETYQQYFSNYTSGVIVFCRVYKIDKSVGQAYLQKGKQGSVQVIKLYDKFGLETSMDVGGFVPVISDNKFEYIKDEVIHFLKTENVFISLYKNNLQDKERLDARIEAERALKNIHNSRFDFDENLEMDMAQLDYDLIFDEVISICPNMKPIINMIRNIKAARFGEAEHLLKQRYNNEIGLHAKQRLFDMNVRVAVKDALYFYKRYGVNIEDAFQEACIGILTAIEKYTDNVQGQFGTYASWWMYRLMQRNLPIYQYNTYVSFSYKEKLSHIVDMITDELGDNFEVLSWNELVEWIQLCSDVSIEEANFICSILVHADSIEKLIEDDEELFSDNGEQMCFLNEQLTINSINSALNSLNERERNIIKMRYGIHEMTLRDIGNKLGLTRERVRQIEAKTIIKMKRYIHKYKLFNGVYREFTEEELYPEKFTKKKQVI